MPKVSDKIAAPSSSRGSSSSAKHAGTEGAGGSVVSRAVCHQQPKLNVKTREPAVLTQDLLVDLVGEVEALRVCEVLQQVAVDLETLVTVLGAFQGELRYFSAETNMTALQSTATPPVRLNRLVTPGISYLSL